MNRLNIIAVLTLLAGGTVTEAMGYTNGEGESLSCYQDGRLILESQERLRTFRPTSAMTLVAEVSTGQVQETSQKIYGSEHGGLVCVVSDKQ
jgi:hypothetical protein